MRLIDLDSIKPMDFPSTEMDGLDAARYLNTLPIIDAVPVDDNTGKCVFLIGKHQYVVPDGYCYLGERKEGAGNG